MKLIRANITTVSGQMYLLPKIHDVGGQEHVTDVHMHNESNPRKYCHSFIEMYILTKIHDVGGPEHVTAVHNA